MKGAKVSSPVRLSPIVFAGLLLTAAQAGAQINGFIDAGSGTLKVGSQSPSSIFRLAPSIRFDAPSLAVRADADFAGHTETGWQSTGKVEGTTSRRILGPVFGGLGAEGAWSRTAWQRSGGGWLGGARLQVGSEKLGLGIRVGSGHSFSPAGTQPLSRTEAGGWGRFGRIDLGLWLKRTGLTAPSDESRDPLKADTLEMRNNPGQRMLQDHYTDAEASIGWTRGSLALEAGAGRRFARTVRFSSWYVRASYQLDERLGLIVSSGQFPVDLVSGLPSGTFTTFSLRFKLRSDPPAPRSLGFARVESRPQAFQTTANPDGTHLLTLHIPSATSVEVMGDFTNWEAVLLVPAEDDRWQLRMRITPGFHEINLRVSGGPWIVPPGLTATDDGLGGRVGMFVIE